MALHHVQESDGYAEDEEPMLSTSGRGSDGAVDLDSNSAPEDSDETAGLGKELRRWHDAKSAHAPAPAVCIAQLASASHSCCRLVTLGIPLSTVSLLSYTANIVSLAYVGRLSAHSLAAAVLGNRCVLLLACPLLMHPLAALLGLTPACPHMPAVSSMSRASLF